MAELPKDEDFGMFGLCIYSRAGIGKNSIVPYVKLFLHVNASNFDTSDFSAFLSHLVTDLQIKWKEGSARYETTITIPKGTV
jgi:hypothetical protein